MEKVKEELAERGLKALQINLIEKYISIEGDNTVKLKTYKIIDWRNTKLAKKELKKLKFLTGFQIRHRQTLLLISHLQEV